MTFKERYMIAKANGLVERFRGDEISKEIAKTIPANEQQALQTNMLDDLLNGVPFSHQAEWERYQEARRKAKTAVDEKISKIEEASDEVQA
jgi:LPS O-antigen subunit length determinant protein (WzzB/FepE family)